MGTDMDALIAACAAGFIPNHFSFTQSQRPGWAAGDALTAMIADLPGFRIVAVCAMQRAALEKNRAAVTGSVNVGKGNDPVDQRLHCPRFSTRRSSALPLSRAPWPKMLTLLSDCLC